MEWYYEKEGKQAGPVTEDQLREMRNSGTVLGSTLIWRAGMSQWQPCDSALTVSGPSSVTDGGGQQHKCCECGRYFSQQDMINYQALWVCADCKPIFFQRIREGGAGTGNFSNVWRDGKKLVMTREACLPDRCIKCNAPANGFQQKRKISWHSPIYYVLLIKVLLYIIVAAIASKRATVHFGLCETHRRKYKTGIIITWCLVLLAVAAFFVISVKESGLGVLIGFLILLGAIIYGNGFVAPVRAAKIDRDYIRLNGVGREYLEQLPEWTGDK